jgi:hypothetical protein
VGAASEAVWRQGTAGPALTVALFLQERDHPNDTRMFADVAPSAMRMPIASVR